MKPVYYAPIPGQSVSTVRARELRAKYARDRDEMLAFQKQAADRETARFFKDEAGNLLKLWRAADHWFKWAAGEQGWKSPSEWPCELADEFDQVHGLCT